MRSTLPRLRPYFFLFLFPFVASAQSLSVFDVDATAFPTITAKFYSFDADGNQISGLSPGDVLVQEDGIPRTVTSVSCPPVSPPEAISSVLTIDISGSMSGSGIRAAKAAAKVWVNMLPLGKSECAITTFNGSSYLNQDFTTDRNALLDAIDAISSGGMTDYDDALITPPAGSLEVTKRGKNKKVVVFLSDGQPNNTPNKSAIIAEAQRQKATIYGVILNMSAPQVVKDICSQTGGIWFDNIESEQQAEDAYRQILQTAQGGQPCELEWISDGCNSYLSLELSVPSVGAATQTSYQIPAEAQPQLVYTPSRSMRFGKVTPGTTSQQQITITAQGKPVDVDDITLGNAWFSISDYGGSAPPFTLGVGQSRALTVEYSPLDSTYAFSRFEVTGDACSGNSFYADGGWTGMQSQQVHIKVTRANGGEQFIAGSDEELSWEGVIPEEKVKLEYSTDGGTNWTLITDSATGLRYSWRVPQTPSFTCLLRAKADIKQRFLGEMVLIPSATFRMGDLRNTGYTNEKPVHTVWITQPFYMSRTEVTQEQYEAVMGKNPSNSKGAGHPVENITWVGVTEFCNELSLQEGLQPCYSGYAGNMDCDFSANGYRMPTEAEWELACRARSETDFYTGNMVNEGCTPLDPGLDRAGWYCGNSKNTTHPVAQKEPNAFGLYDMHGNVEEWVWDLDGVYNSSTVKDPKESDYNRPTFHIQRGGSWNNDARKCRSSMRDFGFVSGGSSTVGIRIVRNY